MAYKLVERILRVRGITPTQKLVLVQTADYCNKDTKIAKPSAEALAADTGLSERTVRTAWKWLRAHGFLIVHKNATQNHQYEWRFGDDAIDAHSVPRGKPRPETASGLNTEDGGARPETASGLNARPEAPSGLNARPETDAARPETDDAQTGNSFRQTRKEPVITSRGRAREPEARAPALEPDNPAPKQTEMLLPIAGGAAARDPLKDARERLAAVQAEMDAMSSADPRREVHIAIVARIKAEIRVLEAA